MIFRTDALSFYRAGCLFSLNVHYLSSGKDKNLLMKILILYHSGAGNTRLVSELIYEQLRQAHKVEIHHIRNEFDRDYLSGFDLLILGFPTHHTEPSLSMKEFVNHLSAFEQPAKSFIFTTYGLYPGNSLRILAKQLNDKNIEVLYYEEFRAPATDGVLLFSEKLKFMFEFERKLNEKIKRFVEQIENYTKLDRNKMPPYKWYEPLNDLVKPLGVKYYDKLRSRMQILTDVCTNCNLCVKVCDRSAWQSHEPTPVFTFDNCEFCLECVHKCPSKAIVFSGKTKDKPHLNQKFYRRLKKEIMDTE